MSDQPGSCQTEGCSLYQQPLSECTCEDGNHNGMMDMSTDMGTAEDTDTGM